MCVDELVAVGPVADDPYFAAFVDELKEDGEQAEATAVDDGGAANHDDGEVVLELLEGRTLRRTSARP